MAHNPVVKCILIVFGLVATTPAYSIPFVSVVERANAAMIACRFDEALAVADSLTSAHPDDPLPLLLSLSALGLRDLDVEVSTASRQFESTCSLTVRKIDALELRSGVSSYSKTIRGLALAALTSHYLRQNRYLNAVGSGLDALGLLRQARALDSANADVDFFFGLYNCAKGDLKKKFWWVLFWYPGGEREGIEQLENCAQNGILAKEAAQLSLADAYVRARRFDEAGEALEKLEKAYPGSRFVWWAQARYLEALGSNRDAARLYGLLSGAYRSVDNGVYNALVTGCSQARLLLEAGDRDGGTMAAMQLEGLCPGSVVESQIDDVCRELKTIERKALQQDPRD